MTGALLLLASAAVAAQGPRVIRGPYLEAVTRHSAAVCWRTDLEAPSVIEWGPEGAARARLETPGERRDHCVELRGLKAGQAYAYRLTLPPDERPRTFRAADGPSVGAIRFGVLGDSGKAGEAVRQVGRRIALDPPQLMLHVGDVVYPKGADADYDDAYFRPFGEFIDRVPVYIAVGNHDYANIYLRVGKGRRWLEENFLAIHRFPSPAAARPEGSDARTYYSFDWGPAHFAAVDVNRAFRVRAAPSLGPDSPQVRWLEADLAASTAPWKFVFFHVAAYTSCGHGPDSLVQDTVSPVLERAGVDVAFQGHSHCYERSYPIRAGRRAERGVVYVTAGNGGASLTRRHRDEPWSAAWASRHGYVDVRVQGRTFNLSAVDADGTVFDRWELTK